MWRSFYRVILPDTSAERPSQAKPSQAKPKASGTTDSTGQHFVTQTESTSAANLLLLLVVPFLWFRCGEPFPCTSSRRHLHIRKPASQSGRRSRHRLLYK
ncbi:hypothetical protein E2C01_072848 [Portunus trituberculatus]|uniref:Uncharacterized protein n=1 Tax=Portunus trituberculatus TaxID=210409 RepID=A0A5B7I7T1_PORTR|nr:hypothetical protein [Portunus trituberculatus]